MEERRYQSQLQDPANFMSGRPLIFVEIHNFEHASSNQIQKGILKEEHVQAWLEGEILAPRPSESLRIITSHQLHREAARGLSRQTFEAIVNQWQIPHQFLHLSGVGRPTFSKCENENDEKQRYIFSTSMDEKQPAACAIVHDPHTYTTLILLDGVWPSDRFNLLCLEIQHLRDFVKVPLLLPLCILHLCAEDMDIDIAACRAELGLIQRQTGMAGESSWEKDGFIETFDFVAVSRRMAKLSTLLGWCEICCEAHLILLDRLDNEMTTYISKDENIKKKIELLQRKSDIFREWTQANLLRIKSLIQQVLAYNQTITTLMAKKDNILNIRMTEASLRIAEASQRDSAAMKALAEDSKQVALATSRDSSLMRIIAILTLVFLPATFTATLFSTSFFDFKPPDDNSTVSSRFWLYWVVTLVLTAVTIGGAGYFWRETDRKITEKFDKSHAELEKLETTSNDTSTSTN